LKARYDDLHKAARLCVELGAREAGEFVQTDTYFNAPRGRLKLRQTEPDRAELIWYLRADQTSSCVSDYSIARVRTSEAPSVLAVLDGALGIRSVVRKTRRLLLWKNVRIHLDRVETLGNFVEFEAVLGPGHSEADGHARIVLLVEALNINGVDRVAQSYLDLTS
jgi:adenylate cyclase class IV